MATTALHGDPAAPEMFTTIESTVEDSAAMNGKNIGSFREVTPLFPVFIPNGGVESMRFRA
jgi:hypothetical protein